MSEYNFSTQTLKLEGVINARELGGYVLPDGSRIKPGMLMRGGSLAKASDADMEKLKDLNLAHIFDFRTKDEVHIAPDREVEGAEYHWLPAIDPATIERVETGDEKMFADLNYFMVNFGNHPQLKHMARIMYSSLVTSEYTQLQYATFLQFVAKSEGSVYWHCSQGKDRTGLGAAFLLSALGADRKLIMEDYIISNEFYKADVDSIIEQQKAKGWGEAEFNVVRTFVGVNPVYFEQALDIIEEDYGSMDSYLRNELCLTEDDIQLMRSKYLCR